MKWAGSALVTMDTLFVSVCMVEFPRNILPLSCRPLPRSVLLEYAVGLPRCVQSAGETPPTNEI